MIMKHYIAILTLSLSCLLLSCNKDEDYGKDGFATRIEATFGKYYNEANSVVSKTWTAKDSIMLLKTDQTVKATPVMEGRADALFMFETQTRNGGENLILCYPASDDIVIENDAITFEIPAAQNGGKMTPVYIGHTVSNGSAYLEPSVTISPYWHTLYLVVTKAGMSVKKAVMTAAAGEKLAGEVAYSTDGLKATGTEAAVTVEFSSAKSCASGLNIPFRVAPVTLEDGFIITLTDSNGKEHTFTHDRKVDMKVGERTVFETTL
jgi:hypothetical protein